MRLVVVPRSFFGARPHRALAAGLAGAGLGEGVSVRLVPGRPRFGPTGWRWQGVVVLLEAADPLSEAAETAVRDLARDWGWVVRRHVPFAKRERRRAQQAPTPTPQRPLFLSWNTRSLEADVVVHRWPHVLYMCEELHVGVLAL